MRIAKRAGIVILLLMMLALAGQPVAAQNVSSHWFPETRHSVYGYFFDFYYSVPDPLTQFGFPITYAFRDSSGRLTQYFQRARFDLIDTAQGPVVILADLGSFLYVDIGAGSDLVQDGPTCRLFQKTGKTVCYDFLKFYDAHQGAIYFGDPISGIENRDGRQVQYFTKVRLEFDKSLPGGGKVVISQLGRPAFDKYEGNPIYIFGQDPGPNGIPITQPVTSIIARAFVRAPLLSAGQQQIVYVIVQDQALFPVQGAQVTVVTIYPDGKSFPSRQLDLTAADGVLKIPLSVSNLAPRQVVELQLTVQFQGLKASASTSFRIWY